MGVHLSPSCLPDTHAAMLPSFLPHWGGEHPHSTLAFFGDTMLTLVGEGSSRCKPPTNRGATRTPVSHSGMTPSHPKAHRPVLPHLTKVMLGSGEKSSP